MITCIPKRDPISIVPGDSPEECTHRGMSEEEKVCYIALLTVLAEDAKTGTRLEVGDAPISWEPQYLKRLQDYVNNGFPLMARCDESYLVVAAATAVLGPLTGWDGKKHIDDLEWHCRDIMMPSKERAEAVRLENYAWEVEKEVARYKRSSTTLEDIERRFGRACEDPWWILAATRKRAGHPYFIRLGDPRITGPQYSDGNRRLKLLSDKGWPSPDAMFDRSFTWSDKFIRKYGKLFMCPDMRSPAFSVTVRRIACGLYGYEDPRLIRGSDADIRRHHILSTGIMSPAHRWDSDSLLRLAAVRKFGVLAKHVNDGCHRIRLRHRMRYGFTPEEMSLPGKMPEPLQAWYLRKFGVDSPMWSTSIYLDEKIKARVRRALDNSGIAEGAKEVCRVCDYLMQGGYDDIKRAAMQIFGADKSGTSPIVGTIDDEMRFFMALAVETIAAHPEVAQEMEMYLNPLEPGKRKLVFMNAVSFIQQNADGILTARERRMLGVGIKRTASTVEVDEDE